MQTPRPPRRAAPPPGGAACGARAAAAAGPDALPGAPGRAGPGQEGGAGVGTSNGARPGPDAPALEAAIVENLQFGLGVPPAAISGGVDARTAYRGVAASVRERLIEGFNATQDFWRCEGRGTAAWGLPSASGC